MKLLGKIGDFLICMVRLGMSAVLTAALVGIFMAMLIVFLPFAILGLVIFCVLLFLTWLIDTLGK